jgi:hypothetical protein
VLHVPLYQTRDKVQDEGNYVMRSFIILSLHELLGNNIQIFGRWAEYAVLTARRRMCRIVKSEKLKGRKYFEDPSLVVGIILKLSVLKCVRM